MNLHLTSEQELFRSTTEKFLEREATTAQLRKLAAAGSGFDRAWWSTAAELGWTLFLVPEELEGGTISGDRFADLAIVAEELGRFAAPGPFAVTNAVIAGLTESEGGAGHAETIGAVKSGERVATWAVYEPGRGWEPLSPRMTAERHEDGFVLRGAKDRVEAGDQADVFLVGAKLDGALCEFLVPADAKGICVERMWGLDFTRHYATVTFDDVVVPSSAMVGPPGEAQPLVERQCQTMFVLQSAETAGATARAFGMTLEWTMNRYPFGRLLASYQAIKHRCADMKTWLEAMHAITDGALRAVESRSADAASMARAAKIFTSTRALSIIQDCVQIHGGIGVTWEHDLHIFLRRAAVNRTLYGTPAELRRELSFLLASERRGLRA